MYSVAWLVIAFIFATVAGVALADFIETGTVVSSGYALSCSLMSIGGFIMSGSLAND